MNLSKNQAKNNKRLLVDEPWIKVISEDVEFPNGVVVKDFYSVERPDYVAVLPVFTDRKIILVEQYRHGPRAKILNLPMGVINKGEATIDAARRELEEETGYMAKKITPIGVFVNNPAFLRLSCHLYIATELESKVAATQDHQEQTEVVILTLDKALEMLGLGEIQDMSTATAIYALAGRGE